MTHSLILQDLAEFQRAGETLFGCRCNNSHSGNLSVRHADQIVITRRGAMLARLGASDLVATGFTPADSEKKLASTELAVHLKIYEGTQHQAIAHAHALSAVAVGWLGDRIKLIDVEGAYYFGSIAVLEHHPATAAPALGEALGRILASEPVVVVRGHGVFACGTTLEQAAQRVTSVNDSAELIIKARQLGLDLGRLEKAPYLDFGRSTA